MGPKISSHRAELATLLGERHSVLRVCPGSAKNSLHESLNAQVRKAVRIRGHFPSEEAATKLIYLVLRKVQARWKNPPIFWQAAKTQPAIQFEDRFVVAE